MYVQLVSPSAHLNASVPQAHSRGVIGSQGYVRSLPNLVLDARRSLQLRFFRFSFWLTFLYACHRSMRRAARMRPTPKLRTAAARHSAPMYARFIKPFGCFAVGDATDRKNAAGMRIAAIGAPVRASHFQKGESTASSTYRSMTS